MKPTRAVPKTIDEIAKATGVSRTTVNLVLGGKADRYRISQSTRDKVEQYVAAHGITVNRAARSLKLGRSDLIGLIVPDMANAFFARLAANLDEECQKSGHVLVTTSTSEKEELERRAVQHLIERNVEGIILAPCCLPESHFKDGMPPIPVVTVDRHYPQSNFPNVGSDHFFNAKTLTSKMIDSRGEDIVLLCGRMENPAIAERAAAFIETLALTSVAVNDTKIITDRFDSISAGRTMAESLSASGVLPSSIICSSLLVLEGAMRYIKMKNRNWFKKVAFGVFDYDGMLDLVPNEVHCIQQDEEAIAREVFLRLKHEIEGVGSIDGAKRLKGRLITLNG